MKRRAFLARLTAAVGLGAVATRIAPSHDVALRNIGLRGLVDDGTFLTTWSPMRAAMNDMRLMNELRSQQLDARVDSLIPYEVALMQRRFDQLCLRRR